MPITNHLLFYHYIRYKSMSEAYLLELSIEYRIKLIFDHAKFAYMLADYLSMLCLQVDDSDV